MRQIILDTETTGLEPSKGHRIIEIGCIELVNRQFTHRHFHTYIQPEREIDPGAQAVHGITGAFLKDKPLFKNIFDDFLEFIRDAELIIHNAPFDVGFLNHEFNLLGYPQTLTDHCSIVDTLALAKQMHPGQRNSLDALCKRYSIDNSHRELHGALLDARLLAEVYLIMTGGQTTLFDNEATPQNPSIQRKKTTTQPIKTLSNLPVIEATSEEIQAHLEQLKLMQEKFGKCLWDKL